MFVHLFYIFLHFHVLFAVTSVEEDIQKSNSVYVFGDSNFVTKPKSDSWMKAGYWPYGTTCMFIQDDLTRFTNGQTIPELIATSLQRNGPDNYASASAGILPETGTASGNNSAFKDQIRIFGGDVQNDLKGLKEKYHSEELLSRYMSKAIFLINIGASDYIHNYFQPNYYNTSKRYNGDEFSELLIKEYGGYLKELHKLGARKMVIFEIGPLGCLPYMIEKFNPSSRCAENVNKMVLKFNNKLDVKLKELSNELVGSHFVTARMFSLIENMIKSPTDYGFDETRWACCAIEKDGTGLCKHDYVKGPSENPDLGDWHPVEPWTCNEFPMPESLKKAIKWTGPHKNDVCWNRVEHLFFDELHLTQSANRIIADRCVAGTGDVCSPQGLYKFAVS